MENVQAVKTAGPVKHVTTVHIVIPEGAAESVHQVAGSNTLPHLKPEQQTAVHHNVRAQLKKEQGVREWSEAGDTAGNINNIKQLER